MRSLIFALVALICIAILLFVARTSRSTSEPHVQADPSQTRTAPAAVDGELGAGEPPSTSARSVGGVTQTANDSGSVRCRVLGRVVDEASAPQAGVPVALVWGVNPYARKVGVDVTSEHGWLETPTAADGRFEIVAPLPVTDTAWIGARPDALHLPEFRSFGAANGSSAPSLLEGDNDCGDIVVKSCGTISGRAMSPEGKPIEGATVTIDEHPAEVPPTTVTNANGGFDLAQVPVGHHTLGLAAPGWTLAAETGFDAGPGGTTALGDVVLQHTQPITGFVVDEAGKRLPRIQVSTYSRDQISTTRDDGSFTLDVPPGEPLMLCASGLPEYSMWSSDMDEGVLPGTKDVRIQLRRLPSGTFRVIDARTHDPIEKFGIRITFGRASGLPGAFRAIVLEESEHQGGTASLSLAGDTVVVGAPGYAPLEAKIGPEIEHGEQVLALHRGASVEGRIVASSAPIPHAIVRLAGDFDASADPVQGSRAHEEDENALGAYSGRVRTSISGADGGFRFVDLAPGTYTLRVESRGHALHVVSGLVVPSESTLPLGDVALETSATIRGTIELGSGDIGAGISPAGFHVRLVPDARGVVTVDATGAFAFTQLEPGTHVLQWTPPALPFSNAREKKVDVAAGSAQRVTIDGLDGVCCVIVHVVRKGQPAAGIRPIAHGNDAPPSQSGNDVYFAESGPDGSAVGFVVGGAAYELVVDRSAWRPTDGGAARIQATSHGRIERTFELVTGRLVLASPDLEIPKLGQIRIDLRGPRYEYEVITILTEGLHAEQDSGPIWTGGDIDLGEQPAHEYWGTVKVQRFDAGDPGHAGTFTDLIPEQNFRLSIEEGREGRIVVPRAK